MTHSLRILLARVRGLLHRDAIAEEIRDELRFHMEMRTDEYERRGLTPEAARRQARKRVGNLALHQDRGYDVRGGGVMETIVRDIRYSVRLLLKQRGFAAVAIVTLGLAIGAVTAVVSVIDATMLRPLPYPDPEQLVSVSVSVPLRPGERPRNLGPSMEDVRNWQAAGGVFSSLAVSRTVGFGRILDGEQPERVQIRAVTEQYLAMYGVVPLHGRDFTAEDIAPGAPAVAMLGHGYWQSHFGGDPEVVGETIRIGGEPYTIIGVLPPGLADARIVWPLRLDPEFQNRRGMGTSIQGRLLPGMTVEQAAERLSASLEEVPGPDGSSVQVTANVSSRLEAARNGYRTTVTMLAGAVAFVLLLACVNVGGLQLARGATRQAELAVRASLGAGRGRLMRQLMVENLVLAGAGAALGLALAGASLDVLAANLPLSLPSNAPLTLNATVLAACAAVTMITAILFGFVPAARLSRIRLGTALARAGGRQGSSLSRRSSQLLMGVEIALAVVLVVGAALMLRSFARVMAVDVGYDPDAIVTMEVVPVATDAATHQQYYPALVRNLRLVPGIDAAGAVDFPPGAGSFFGGVSVGEESHFVEFRSVLPGYVEALGPPVTAGRAMADDDYGAGAKVAMLNESAAREMFPDSSPIGRSFTRPVFDDAGNRIEVEWEVIGVIGDVRHNGPMSASGNEIFFPYEANATAAEQGRGLVVVVRPGEPIPDLANRLREAAESVGPRVLVESVRTGGDWLDGHFVTTTRQRTVLLSLLGGLGLVLALVGVFGITAYAVARRTREIGVRMTFGARPHQVVGRIVRDAAVPVGAGIMVGLFGALAATRVIESFLFETAPTDPGTFAIVAVILGVTGCGAAWIPARRAVQVDPVSALRTD